MSDTQGPNQPAKVEVKEAVSAATSAAATEPSAADQAAGEVFGEVIEPKEIKQKHPHQELHDQLVGWAYGWAYVCNPWKNEPDKIRRWRTKIAADKTSSQLRHYADLADELADSYGFVGRVPFINQRPLKKRPLDWFPCMSLKNGLDDSEDKKVNARSEYSRLKGLVEILKQLADEKDPEVQRKIEEARTAKERQKTEAEEQKRLAEAAQKQAAEEREAAVREQRQEGIKNLKILVAQLEEQLAAEQQKRLPEIEIIDQQIEALRVDKKRQQQRLDHSGRGERSAWRRHDSGVKERQERVDEPRSRFPAVRTIIPTREKKERLWEEAKRASYDASRDKSDILNRMRNIDDRVRELEQRKQGFFRNILEPLAQAKRELAELESQGDSDVAAA